jgi:hypothetical protein
MPDSIRAERKMGMAIKNSKTGLRSRSVLQHLNTCGYDSFSKLGLSDEIVDYINIYLMNIIVELVNLAASWLGWTSPKAHSRFTLNTLSSGMLRPIL